MYGTAILITNPAFEIGTPETLPPTEGLQVITREELRGQSGLRFGKNDKVCLTTESTFEDVHSRMDDENRKQAVRVFKDKLAFRKLIHSFFPDFYFERCQLDELSNKKLPGDKKLVLKPVKG